MGSLLEHHVGSAIVLKLDLGAKSFTVRLAQSVERKALNLVVVGSSPTVGVLQ